MTSETVNPMTETAPAELDAQDLDKVVGGLPAVQTPNGRKAGGTQQDF